MPTDQQAWEDWFLTVWSCREDVVYRQLFGNIGKAIHTIPKVLFERMGQAEIDPRWTTHGVFECPPHGGRNNWLYVTSGLSNPWGLDPAQARPDAPSGLGLELVLQTQVYCRWATQVLQWLIAVQILAASGLVQGDVISDGMRIPLHTSIDPGQESAIRNLLVARSEDNSGFQLESGNVQLLLCVGITDSEMQFARETSSADLLEDLKIRGVYPLTDAQRKV